MMWGTTSKQPVVMAGVVAALYSLPASAQPQPPAKFISVDRYIDSGGVRLSGGRAARPEDWRAIALWIGRLQCTAVLIGPQVVATSAHCLDATPEADRPTLISGSIKFGNQSHELLGCEMHPDYAKGASNGIFPRSGHDYALCKLQAPAAPDPETVGSASPAVGDPVLLMGLGCYDLKIKNGSPDPKYDPPGKPVLRIGDQRVQARFLALNTSGPTLSRTVSGGSEPNVCPGDSGAPVLTGATVSSPARGRRVSGFNSAFHGKWSAAKPGVEFHSYFAPVQDEFRRWAEQWATKNQLQICGIQLAAGLAGCRL